MDTFSCPCKDVVISEGIFGEICTGSYLMKKYSFYHK